MRITSEIEDKVAAIADERLPENWGACVKPKHCRHGFKITLHVNTPQGHEQSAPLRGGSVSLTDQRIAYRMDLLVGALLGDG